MKIQDELLQYANSGDSDESTSNLMRKAAMKIAYLEEVLRAVRIDDIKNYPFNDVRSENWVDARDRALKAGNQ